MRTAPATARLLCAAVLALLLGCRLLSPAGFMPSFEHGSVVIAPCPDAGIDMAQHPAMNHHGGKTRQQPCPYASAASLGALGPAAPFLSDIVALGLMLLLGRTFLFLERHSVRDRPPSRAPPLPRLT